MRTVGPPSAQVQPASSAARTKATSSCSVTGGKPPALRKVAAVKPRLAPWTCSWSEWWCRAPHSRSTGAEMLTGSGCTDPIQRPIPSVAERCWAFSQSGVTVESASVIANHTRDPSDGLEPASTCRTPASRARPTHRACRRSTSTPCWLATSTVESVQLSATTTTVAATPVLSKRWAAASRTDVRHRPISAASLCAGMTTCTANGVGKVMRRRPARPCRRRARVLRSPVRSSAPAPVSGSPSRQRRAPAHRRAPIRQRGDASGTAAGCRPA